MSFTIEQGVDNFKRYRAILVSKREDLDERLSALDELDIDERSTHISICVWIDEDKVKTLMKDVYDKFPSMHTEIDSYITSKIDQDVYPNSGYGVSYSYNETFYEDIKNSLSDSMENSKYKKTFAESMESTWLRPAVNIIGGHCQPEHAMKHMSFNLTCIDSDDYTYEDDYINFTGLSCHEDTIGNHEYYLKENILEIEDEIERMDLVLEDLDTWLVGADLNDFIENAYEGVASLEQKEMTDEQLNETKLVECSTESYNDVTADLEEIKGEIVNIEMAIVVVETSLAAHNSNENFTSYYTESCDFDEEFKKGLISHIEEEIEKLEEDESSVIVSSPSM